MKNILNFFNKKTEYNQKKAELSPDAIAFVADEHKIYAKNNWFGGSGSGESTVVEYDDTELRNSINTLSSRVDGLDTMTEQNVEEIVTPMIANIKSFVDGFTWEGMFNDNDWKRTMSSYILENLAINDDGNTVSYSQFYQAFKTLQGVVQDIEVASSSDEGITTDTIQSMIARTIDGNTIINWVKNNQDVLNWLASGFTTQANQGGSFAQVYAADKTATDNAISVLDDRVTAVEGTVGNNTSAIVQLNNAVANTMSSTDINAAITNATSALDTKVTNLSNSMSNAITKDANGNISVSANNIFIESENLRYATNWNNGNTSTQGLTIDKNLISMYRTDGEETSIKTSTVIKPGYIHMSNMDSEEEFIFSTGGGSSSQARIYTYGDFSLWSPNVNISTPSAGKINLSTGTVDIDGKIQASNAEIDNLTTLNLSIPESGIINVPTPAGNGLYIPNEGYTGTINGARFVKGICVGAA